MNNNEEALKKGYGSIHVTEKDKGIFVAANALIFDSDGRMLIVKRSAAKGGNFALPGGTKQSDESVSECVKREMAEEIGLNIPAERYVVNNVFECFSEFKGKQSNVIHFGCVATVSDEEKAQIHNAEPEKCDGLFWLTKEEIFSQEVAGNFFLSWPNIENYYGKKTYVVGLDVRKKDNNLTTIKNYLGKE